MNFYSASFDAIGVRNQVTVTDPDQRDRALEIARREVAALDRACSRFRADSELTAVNARAGLRPVHVSALLYEAIDVALAAAAATDGLVDPTIGAAVRELGYDRDYDVVVAGGSRPSFRLVPATGWRSVELDRDAATVRLRPGTELDLGATAKALAADRIARAVRDATRCPVLVALGGDIAVAGSPVEGWPVRVSDNHRDASGGQTITFRHGGLATSSTTVRRWRAGGVEHHHIVDPRTGAAVPELWRTVSVAAATCVDANAAATAAIVLGAGAPRWLEQLGLPARLVHPDGTVVSVCEWPVPSRLTGSPHGSPSPIVSA
jgi:thiamine biosynthesis lipoprotein